MKTFLTTLFSSAILLISFVAQAQNAPIVNATVSGKILDASNDSPLIGATVTIKGTTNGAATDANGEFQLVTGQKLPFTLVVSFLGYIKKETVIEGSGVTIKLDPSAGNLEDVIISSRRRQESAQEVPIPISVIRGSAAEDAGGAARLARRVPDRRGRAGGPEAAHEYARGPDLQFPEDVPDEPGDRGANVGASQEPAGSRGAGAGPIGPAAPRPATG